MTFKIGVLVRKLELVPQLRNLKFEEKILGHSMLLRGMTRFGSTNSLDLSLNEPASAINAETRVKGSMAEGGDSSGCGVVEVANQLVALEEDLDQRWELRVQEIMDKMSPLLHAKSDGREARRGQVALKEVPHQVLGESVKSPWAATESCLL